MRVLNRELDGRALGGLHEPEEEISALSRFEEDAIVARALEAQIVDVLLSYLALDLILLLGVRKYVDKVVHEIPELRVDTPCT